MISQQASSPATQHRRIDWIDYAKGIAIFLVVVGHVFPGLTNAGLAERGILNSITDWAYAFHMPLFFFISGMFVLRSIVRPPRDFIISKLKVVAYPYVVWSTLQFLVMNLSSGTNHELNVSLAEKLLISPQMQFWFLYALFFIYLIFLVLYRMRLSLPIIFGVSLVLVVIDKSLNVPGILDSIVNSFPFFVAGALFGEMLKHRLPQMSTLVLAGISLVAFGAMTAIWATGVSIPDVWVSSLLEDQAQWGAQLLMASLGIIGALPLSVILSRLSIDVIRYWGAVSLQIYLAHIITGAGFRIVLAEFLGIDNLAIHIVGGLFMGIYGPILLDWFFNRIGFKYGFTLRDLGRSKREKPTHPPVQQMA